MSARTRTFLLILVMFIVLDGLVWWATYRVVVAPSPEELEVAAMATPPLDPSSVQPRGDNFWQRVSLNGSWRYHQTGSEEANYFSPYLDVSNWRIMAVPQNWYLAGLNYHGVIWFRREFAADPAWQGRVVRLQFAGVDYLADVWLNGQKLGHHEGYFQPFTFAVSDRLNYGEKNVLAVRVESPYEEYKTVWPHQKTLLKGILAHDVTRPGGGWDPAGQEYNTGGIWNDVSLIVSDSVTVDAVQLQAIWPATVTATSELTLTAQLELHNHADASVEATIHVNLIPRNFDGDNLALPSQSVRLRRGRTGLDLSGLVHNPRLWWPWDRGEPNLYTAQIRVTTERGIIAEKDATFGFRQILVGDDWTWTLNGQRFFPRGANYVSSQWLSQTDRTWYERDVGLMREANLNFIRVHGHVEPVEFYQTTDELGILVWQDFPLQWGYTDAPEFVDEAQRQMQDMIALLSNHPSIVVWNVHNESPWDTPRLSGSNPRQNKRLDELLRDMARDLDPTRYVHLNSGTGDAHVYPGWESGRWRDFAKLPGAPFVTEYGAQALPNMEMMRVMFAPEELIYDSGEVNSRWEFHDFQPRQTFDIAGIEPGETTEAFIASSQAYQTNLIKFATETYRRAKYDPMQGVFYFTFVDNWPGITWSVLDYSRQAKPGFYALQMAMQPILPSIEAPLPSDLAGARWIYSTEKGLDITLWVVNDTLTGYPNAQLHWRLENDAAQPVLEDTTRVHVLADDVSYATTMRNMTLPPAAYRLVVILEDAQGQRLGENMFEFAVIAPEEPEQVDQ